MKKSSMDSILKITPTIVLLGFLVANIVAWFFGIKPAYKYIWIVSPSGKTTVRLPINLALRIIRKRLWELAPVVPINKLSRWQGVMILFRGNKYLLKKELGRRYG